MSNQLDTDTDLMNGKLVTMTFITTFTGLTNEWFCKLISKGKSPEPIKLGRDSHWRESEVERWLAERVGKSRYRSPDTIPTRLTHNAISVSA